MTNPMDTYCFKLWNISNILKSTGNNRTHSHMLSAQIQQMLYLLRIFEIFICLAIKCYIDMFEKLFIQSSSISFPPWLVNRYYEVGIYSICSVILRVLKIHTNGNAYNTPCDLLFLFKLMCSLFTRINTMITCLF